MNSKRQVETAKAFAALFAAVLMLMVMPTTIAQSNGQEAVSIIGGVEPLVEVTNTVSAAISSPTLDSFSEPVLLNQTITWNADGTTTLADDLGRTFSIGIDKNDGSFKLLRAGDVVVQRITGKGISYDITWTPVAEENGQVEKYKFAIVGQTEKPHKIKLPVYTENEKLRVHGNKILSSNSLDAVNATQTVDGIGIDWSDAVSAGYNMGFEVKNRAIVVDVVNSFNVDPTTVDTISATLSPATTDYFEGEKRMVNALGTVYVFYYDGVNIVYKYSTDGGSTWSSKLSSASGTVNGDAHRWTVVNTKVGTTNYITILYFKQNGANTDFYAKRGTTSGGSITWNAATFLFSQPNSSGCGSDDVCAAVTASTAVTSGNIFAAFRYLPSGASTYKYQIRVSADGGLGWSTSNPGTLAEQDSGSATRISMAMTNLASGRMLFAYGKFTATEITYRTFTGTSWSAESSTSGAGMTASTVKQLSADSDTSNVGYVAYLVNAPPSTVKLAKWTSTGSFSGFETPPSGSLTHALPSISIGTENFVHIYTIASSKIYETRKVAGTWQSPQTNFGTTFTSPNQLTAGFSRAAGVWLEGAASPWTIRYDQLTLTIDPGYGCGSKNWGVGYWQMDSNPPPVPVFGRDINCNPVTTLVGRSNYVQLQASNAATVTESYEDSQQGCSPWRTCDDHETPVGGTIVNAQQHNANFPTWANALSCSTSCNLPADLEYRLQNQFLWMADSVSKPVASGAHGYVLTNIWFVDPAAGTTTDGLSWKRILVIDLPNTIVFNSAGSWQYEAHSIGSQDSSKYYTYNATLDQTVFHISIVMGSGTTAGAWHDTGNTPLYQYIKTAFTSSYPGPNGNLVPNTLRAQALWKLFDIENGVSIQDGTGTANNKFKAAYSMGRLSYN
jgi:hypothetical protein